ncbi:MAG: hypothetical protein FJ304_07985 [Planctomycetes bacterium]|nr:hypothetical protein [Planctomycetota bacterium]
MSRRVWGAIGALVLAVAVGCEPAKELPPEVPKGVEPPPPDPVPKESEPAAKAYAEKAVKALTAGKPELLAKANSSRVALKGTMVIDGDNPAARTITATWPDRVAVRNEVQVSADSKNLVRAWLVRGRFTMMQGDREVAEINRSELARALGADARAQHWMALGLPLTDPKAVVYDFQSVTGTAPRTGKPLPIHLMKLATGDPQQVFALTYDAATDLLVRVEYVVRENAVDRRKQWTVTEHKPGPDGLLLPAKIEVYQDGRPVEQWTYEKWEFPATVPDADFEPGK